MRDAGSRKRDGQHITEPIKEMIKRERSRKIDKSDYEKRYRVRNKEHRKGLWRGAQGSTSQSLTGDSSRR